jgi:hypothetical protein
MAVAPNASTSCLAGCKGCERILLRKADFFRLAVQDDESDRLATVVTDSTQRSNGSASGGVFRRGVDVHGFTWPQTQTRQGINAHLNVLNNAEEREGQTFGNVDRWVILGGRLRAIQPVAQGVMVEGVEGAATAV